MELFVYGLLIATSIIGVAFIVERGLALRWRKIVPPEIEAAVESCQSPDDVPMLERVCEQYDAPLSRLLLQAIDHLAWPQDDNTDALQTRARHEIVRLDRGLVVLEIIVGIAPLLGLGGDHRRHDVRVRRRRPVGLDRRGEAGQGIALILRATLVGLLIAIPSLIFWSYYSKKVEMLAVEMETLCDEFIRRQYREQPHAAPARQPRVSKAKVPTGGSPL